MSPLLILSLAIVPALAVIVLYYTRNIKAATKKQAKATGKVADVATEDINALTVIKVFTREEREDLRFGGRGEPEQSGGIARGKPAGAIHSTRCSPRRSRHGYDTRCGRICCGRQSLQCPSPFQLHAGTIDARLIILFLFYLKLLYQPIRDLSKLTNLYNVATAGADTSASRRC